jgi:hypothetical protein
MSDIVSKLRSESQGYEPNPEILSRAADEIVRLRADNAELRQELQTVLDDWNALVAASGSPTNGGAVGYVKAMRADAQRYRWICATTGQRENMDAAIDAAMRNLF